MENLVTCCFRCNKYKKDKHLQDLGWELLLPGTRVVDLVELGVQSPRIVPNPPRKKKRVAHRQRYIRAA